MVGRPTPAEWEEQIKHTQIFSHGVISASSDLWLWDFLKHREFTYLLTLNVFSSVTLSRHFEHQPDSLVHRLPKLPWVFSRFQTPFVKATLTLLTLILRVLVATNLTES